ncbi:MAG TPA: cytidine deaminase [Longimicrobiaceae bacterium]|nr:cytidine deaminase [Longimicrobiaceae bacterium]
MSEIEGIPALDPGTARTLLERAREARRHAYAPYSHFPVGVALLAQDGRVFTGVNVENASYGLGMCAERVAIGRAVAEGAREYAAIAVVGPEDDQPCSPCGACRQVMHEFAPDMVLVTPDGSGWRAWRVDDLLPGAFGVERIAGHGGGV